ncbi:spermatogenesis-associated protein 21-like [Microcaecilia unicolor]|uniref:Spermatogenesis-associated protein 21-like n=1 Tax=Microcaecilia unicolor TaxID=1415580 RepID=A0A6P7ZW02_9AMPH|nr:spermatogenesis-associated protein 21-like [Microcaecilia unicolor]
MEADATAKSMGSPGQDDSEELITEELEEEKQILDEVLLPKKRRAGSAQENQKEQTPKPLDSNVNLVFTLTPKQIAAFQHAFENFRRSRGDKISKDDLQFSLSTMNIYLNRQDNLEALKSADVDKDGKVSFKDFVSVLTDDNRFTLFMESKSHHPRALSNSENMDIILFDAMQTMVTKDFLPGRSMAEILCYYQKKYKDSIRLTLRRKSLNYGSVHSSHYIETTELPTIMGVSERKIRKFKQKLDAEDSGESTNDIQSEV